MKSVDLEESVLIESKAVESTHMCSIVHDVLYENFFFKISMAHYWRIMHTELKFAQVYIHLKPCCHIAGGEPVI